MTLLKNILYITLLVLISFYSCQDRKKVTFRSIPFDSINTYLSLANEDTIPVDQRIRYNQRAFDILKTKDNDSLTRDCLFKVANRFYNLGHLSEYRKTCDKLISYSLQRKDTINIARSYLYIGDYYLQSSVKDSALYFYLKAEKIYKLSGDNTNLALINISKANLLWNEKDYFGSEYAALEALKHLKENRDGQLIFEAYTIIGIVANELSDYDKALEYLNKAIATIQEYNLSSNNPTATTFNNIGNVYQNLNKNDKAISFFNRALSDGRLRSGNPYLYAVLVDNLAHSKYLQIGKNSESTKLFTSSIRIKDSLNNISSAIFSKIRLADYLAEIGEKDTAIILSLDALNLANKYGNPIDRLMPLRSLATLDQDQASNYSKEYIRISDSLQKTERGVKDKFARIQFETDEISLEKDKLEEQNRNLFLFFGGIIMIGLLLFVIRSQRARNRELLLKQAQQKANEDIYNLMLSQQNKIEEGRIKEKKRIARELHDGVLGRLFGARLNLDSLNKMDGDDAENKRNNYLSELKSIEQDIREISHDLNREKFALINNFVAIFNNLSEEQAASHPANITCNVDNSIEWENVNNSLKINLYRITQEALQNINKYASATNIIIELSEHQNTLTLSISDDGKGFNVDKKSRGIGIQNMMSRAQENNGTFIIDSKKDIGTSITIAFPLQKPAEINSKFASTKKQTA